MAQVRFSSGLSISNSRSLECDPYPQERVQWTRPEKDQCQSDHSLRICRQLRLARNFLGLHIEYLFMRESALFILKIRTRYANRLRALFAAAVLRDWERDDIIAGSMSLATGTQLEGLGSLRIWTLFFSTYSRSVKGCWRTYLSVSCSLKDMGHMHTIY